MNKQKICWYSAAAAAFSVNPILADAQMVHTNLDPDYSPGFAFSYPIDLNADGITDVHFIGDHFYTFTSSGGGSDGYSSQQVWIYGPNSIATIGGHIQHLYLGDSVNPDLFFNTTGYYFFNAYRDIDDDEVFIDSGIGWVNNEGFVGLRFEIDGATHYGWVRLVFNQPDPDIMPYILVKEYAYNATPNASAIIDINFASPATALSLSDVAETNTPQDLHLEFTKATDESTVSAYRIALFQGAVMPTIGEIESLTPDRYLEVTPTGEDIELAFDEFMVDVAGNPVESGIVYRAIVLSVADGIYVSGNELSAPSNYCAYAFDAAPTPYGLQLLSDSTTADISGLTGKFYISDTNVSSIRLFVTKNETDLAELLLLDESYYMEIMPSPGLNLVTFTTDKIIYEEGDPALFNAYYLHVVSIPDSVTNSISVKATTSGDFLYPQFPAAPEVSIIGFEGNSSDLLLTFSHLPDESKLEVYRVFVCKEGTEVNAEFVSDLHPIHYESVYPTGADLNMDLTDCNLDTDGDPITLDQPYVTYVAMRCVCDDYFYCISLPSAEFTLLEPVNIESSSNSANWGFSGNELQTTQPVQQTTQLQIISASGQLVFSSNLPAGCTTIQLPQFPAGVLLAYFSNSQGQQVLKFVVE